MEKADLIQVGLIGVAQAALAFVWEGDRESEEAKEAFVRYARMRVKGAMLDELRQMDHLGREQRRKVKVMQVATERWRGSHGSDPTATELSQVCGMDIDEIFELSLAARSGSVAKNVSSRRISMPVSTRASTSSCGVAGSWGIECTSPDSESSDRLLVRPE